MESAIVTALKLGETQITGKCIMKNPGNGREVVISEDTVEVHVVPLLNIQIKTPLIRIRSGAIMPAAVWGNKNRIFYIHFWLTIFFSILRRSGTFAYGAWYIRKYACCLVN